MKRFTYFTLIGVSNKRAPAEELTQKMIFFLMVLEVFGFHLFRFNFFFGPCPLLVYFLKLF